MGVPHPQTQLASFVLAEEQKVRAKKNSPEYILDTRTTRAAIPQNQKFARTFGFAGESTDCRVIREYTGNFSWGTFCSQLTNDAHYIFNFRTETILKLKM